MQLMTYSDVMFLLLIKFPLIAVCVGLPIPGGVFISSFLMGAGCGRLYGEFLRTVFGPSIVPGLYAVVGAASLAGGVTRALSCSVLIFEVTGQISHMMPILVAVLLSVTVANSFNQSLYDTLIVMKNLPYMPNIRGDVFLSQRVSEVMVKDVVTVKERSSPEEIGTLLMEYPTFSSFPVVSERRSILGVIRASQLRLLISESPATPEKLNPGAEGLPEGSYIQDESLRSQKTAPKPVGVERKSSEKKSREILIVPELSPLEVGDNMTVGQLHNMFVMLMPTHAFVVSRGELVGLVRRGDIIQNVGDIGS
uniref:Chloride channel protein n=2 Tax=Rhodosorus marinus TaxID=101924 RepID=A0A7S3E909_9RHOD|mmetsp:Transcript_15601/g.63675  ORF Transcript_15601/g.63675 Transcript_15601/m.63675 type:complete len:309 (+) Transcript_15601:1365-2291(+)